MADELGFDWTVSGDRDVVAANDRIGKSSTDNALKIEAANIRLIKSRDQLTKAEDRYGKGSIEARTAALNLAKAQNTLEKSLNSTSDAVDEGEGKFSKFSGVLQTAGAAAGLAAGAALTSAFAGALEFESANAKLTAQLGLTAKESEKYGKIAGDLYANAYGDSIQTVNEAIKEVRQQKLIDPNATNADIESVTGKVLSLSEAFDQDLAGTARATGQLIRTGLAKDAGEALDLITVGLQKIPGAGDDLLDTLNEYGTQFRSLGLTGPQALNFIAAAMEGGARDTDIAADALKEFNLRARDITNTDAQGALKELGFASQETARKLAGGGQSANDAMVQILTRLREIPDPTDRSRLAVSLLGTQAEDLQDALFAVDPTKLNQGLGDIEGAAGKVDDALGKTAEATLTSFKRSVEQSFTGAAAAVINFAEQNQTIVGSLTAVVGTAATAVVAVNGVASAVKASKRAFENASTAIDAFQKSSGKAKGNAVALGKAAGPLLAYAAVVEIFGEFATSAEDAAVGTGAMAKAVAELNSANAGKVGSLGDDFEYLGTKLEQIADPSLADRIADFNGVLFNAVSLGNFGGKNGSEGRRAFLADLASLDSTLANLVQSGKADQAAAKFKELNDKAVAGGAGVDQLAKHLPQYEDAVAAAGAETEGAVTPVKDLARGLGDQESAARLAGDQLKELAKSTEDYTNAALDARGSARDFEAAIDDASDAVKENGKTLDITTEKGRANADALDEIASSGVAYANQLAVNGGSEKQFQDQMDRTRNKLIAAAEKMGSTKKEAKRLADQILGVPSSRNINFSTNAAAAKERVASFKKEINGVKGKTVTITVRYQASGNVQLREDLGNGRSRVVNARALGGPVNAAEPYIVGERGPELFVPKTAGHIVPRIPTEPRVGFAKPSGDAAGGRMVLEIRSGGSRLDDAIMEIIRRSVRTSAGGNVQVALGRTR